MQRRKFVVGLGSLAAGASVTMGTGALSQSNMDRDMSGEVVGDPNGYLQVASASKYSEVDDNGEIAISLDKLNPDSENWFDTVFTIRNRANNPAGTLTISVTPDDNTSRVGFYYNGNRSTASGFSVDLDPGASLTVGIYVDATQSADDHTRSGTFTISADS